MRRTRAAAGSLAFLVLAPGLVAGLVPWWITGWRVGRHFWAPLRIAGAILLVAGVLVLLDAFVRFVVEGIGTPAPVAPTERLVVGGPYRYVRNPIYVALTAALVGEALFLGYLVLVAYAAAFAALCAGFVRWYEEPTLRRRFGVQYETYRRAVPGWRPRLRPWNG